MKTSNQSFNVAFRRTRVANLHQFVAALSDLGQFEGALLTLVLAIVLIITFVLVITFAMSDLSQLAALLTLVFAIVLVITFAMSDLGQLAALLTLVFAIVLVITFAMSDLGQFDGLCRVLDVSQSPPKCLVLIKVDNLNSVLTTLCTCLFFIN